MRLAKIYSLVAVAVIFVGCQKAEQPPTHATPGSSLDIVREWANSDTAATSTAPDSGVAPVSDMIGGLERRLAEEPDDVGGWSLLAQSYAYMAQMDRAAEAVDRAVQLGADRGELEARVRVAHGGKR